MTLEPNGEVLENFNFMQLDKAEQLQQLLALYTQDTVYKAEPNTYTQTEKNGGSLRGVEDTREQIFIS